MECGRREQSLRIAFDVRSSGSKCGNGTNHCWTNLPDVAGFSTLVLVSRLWHKQPRLVPRVIDKYYSFANIQRAWLPHAYAHMLVSSQINRRRRPNVK